MFLLSNTRVSGFISNTRVSGFISNTRVGGFVSFVILGRPSPWGRYFLTFLDKTVFFDKTRVCGVFSINPGLWCFLSINPGFRGFKPGRALVKSIIFVILDTFSHFETF